MWIVIALVSLTAFIILVLCVPLDVVLHMDVHGRPRFGMRLVWLFGLVSREVRREKKKPEAEKGKVEGKQKLRERGEGVRLVFEILQTKGLLSQIIRLLRDVLSHLKFREFGANLRVGLDNPADTGLLFAFIAPANLLLGSSFPREIRVQPSFADEAVLDGYLYGTARLWPIQLVTPIMGSAFSLPTMRAVKTVVSIKWKRKR